MLKLYEITNMINFFILSGHYPFFLEVDADEKKKCLQLFLLSNILTFTYQTSSRLEF